MDFSQIFKIATEIGQSTSGGFTILCFIASVACWLLYRGTRSTLVTLKEDLEKCNDKHKKNDEDVLALRTKHETDLETLYRRLNNISISSASLWTLINMSGDRRGYQLPPLDEVLEGRMVIKIRAGQPEEGDKRSLSSPLLFSEDQSRSG